MNLKELQTILKTTGRYAGVVDGLWGRLTEAAILLALTDGPDTALTEQDYRDSAVRLGVPVAAIKAVVSVESAGSGFINGRPTILTEPHRFSRSTNRKFDALHPTVSYSKWGARPYPKTQDGRYDVLLKMIRLDIDAGFMSASYGKFQILGENFRACGYSTPAAFAFAQARDEKTQLMAFEKFIAANNLVGPLKRLDWATFARGYNGTSYRTNKYDTKLASAYAKYS